MAGTVREMIPFPVIRKRDGRIVRFDISKIAGAISKAFFAMGRDMPEKCQELAEMVVKDLLENSEGNVPHVEEIQDSVERVLIRERYHDSAKAFILYRAKRTSIREGKSELMDSVEHILQDTDSKAQFNINSTSSKMVKIASSASRTFYLTRVIPSQFAEAHNRGDIHIHDLDYYGKNIHSLQIPLKKLLEKGFSSGYGFIRPPKHISSMGALTAIIIQSCQNDMHGEQALPHFDSQFADIMKSNLSAEPQIHEMEQTMEGLVYNLNMLYSRSGDQVPLSSISIGLDQTPQGRNVAMALLKALENGLGHGETPLFPRVIFQIKEGVNFKEGDPNYDIFQKALNVACRRMNPTFAFMDQKINSESANPAYWGDGGRCSEELIRNLKETEQTGREWEPWGWGNIAQTAINMPRIAFKIAHRRKDFLIKSFHSEIRRTMDMACRQLLHRMDILSGLSTSEMPFVMGEKVYRGSESLKWQDSVGTALDNGILPIGFVGLAEAIYILFGKSYARDEKTLEFALETVEYMNQLTAELSAEFDANFVLTGASSGYSAHRFPILDRMEFSVTPMVNDKKYYTQSFQIQATEEIPWTEKIEIEGRFHGIIPGGHFTFLESRNMPTPLIYEKVLKKMKENGICYGGISFPLTESLENGGIIQNGEKPSGRLRSLRRVAGLLLPLERINSGLIDEMERRTCDL